MLWLVCNPARGQTPGGGSATTQADNAAANVPARAELAAQQESVRRQFRDLTVRMLEASTRLESSDPAAAKAIRQAVEQAQQAMIEQNMGQVSQLVSRGLTALAGSAQGQVVESLRAVLATLEQEAAGRTDEQTTKQWEQYLQRLQELQRQQENISGKATSQAASQAGSQPSSQAASSPGSRPAAASSPADQAKNSSQPASPSAQSQRQEELAQAARKLQQEMSRPAGPTSRPTPGAAATAEAASEMKQAAEQLAQRNSQQAQGAQEQAKQDLAQAQKELKDALEQAKAAQQEQALSQLSAALAKALAAQQELSRQTRALDAQRPKDATPRELLLKLAELAAAQRELAGGVAQVRPLVEADPNLAVFPRVLREAEQAALAAGAALASGQSGPLVQGGQKQVESYLATLLEALKEEMKARQEKQASGGANGETSKDGDSSGEKGLVKHTQELKVLLFLQRELRDQTAEVDKLARQGKLDEATRQAQAADLARRQRQLQEMTQDMQKRQSGQLLEDGKDGR